MKVEKEFIQLPKPVQLYFLQSVSGRRSILELVRMGYTYSQVVKIIELAKSDGYVLSGPDSLYLSPQGESLQSLLLLGAMDSANRPWLMELPSNRIKKIEQDEIYVPTLAEFGVIS